MFSRIQIKWKAWSVSAVPDNDHISKGAQKYDPYVISDIWEQTKVV